MRRMYFNLLALGLILVFNVACNKSSTGTDDEKETEFVATLNDFKGYENWTLKATNTGPDPFLQSAHGVNDNFTRKVYFNDKAKPQNGKFPVGSIIVKELRDANGDLQGALTVLVKRGGSFNSAGNGWEWFMTDTKLSTVMTQGDNETAGGGACAGCHAQANSNNNGQDWVFTKY